MVAITLQLPTELVDRARAEAGRTGRSTEEVLAAWMERNGSSPPESLSDAEVLELCDSQMPEDAQRELSELLWRQREDRLAGEDRPRLEELLGEYRRGLLRKAEALRVAVKRGLRPPLGAL